MHLEHGTCRLQFMQAKEFQHYRTGLPCVKSCICCREESICNLTNPVKHDKNVKRSVSIEDQNYFPCLISCFVIKLRWLLKHINDKQVAVGYGIHAVESMKHVGFEIFTSF